ncbi:MAG: 50S ribosomal protein L35ae [Candidatus Methanomethylicota archaeon]|uniref:50S ribosomal protein L35Ae n=1 Tax=Thermoproteota archaeon TaxID=2056631 RepID=A0A497EUP6_9CREN|nr:MAG: 50S ribosomal protein L35ae [Candidatus Verstraetearchaeota archaeon]
MEKGGDFAMELKGVILSTMARGPRNFSRDVLVKVDGFDDVSSASKLIGRSVTWTSKKGLEVRGRVIRVHGRNGVVVVRFNKPLPGQALSTNVLIS